MSQSDDKAVPGTTITTTTTTTTTVVPPTNGQDATGGNPGAKVTLTAVGTGTGVIAPNDTNYPKYTLIIKEENSDPNAPVSGPHTERVSFAQAVTTLDVGISHNTTPKDPNLTIILRRVN